MGRHEDHAAVHCVGRHEDHAVVHCVGRHEDRLGNHIALLILQELLFQLLHEDHEDRRMDHEDHDEVVGLLLHEGRGGQLGHHTFVLILRELLLEMLLVAGLSLLEDHG